MIIWSLPGLGSSVGVMELMEGLTYQCTVGAQDSLEISRDLGGDGR